jgi:RNA polymerase sigma-70 factor (ECF subfamily)
MKQTLWMDSFVTDTYDILLRSKNGDSEAFRSLVEYYQSYAFSLAFRLLCNEEDARDAVQESFIRIWKHLPEYDLQKKFTTWMYKIVTRICYDRLKAHRRQKIGVFLDRSGNIQLPDGKSLEKELDNRESAQIIKNLAETLTPKQRMVFILRDLQDLEMKEVSRICNMPIHSVKSNLCHARRNIRIKMENLEERVKP